MITFQHVSKLYRESGENDVLALDDLSFSFPDRGMVAVIGPSGCGKTTLLNLLAGFDRPTEGIIYMDGKSTEGISEKEWEQKRSREIGFVFQDYNLMEELTVKTNILLPLWMQNFDKKEAEAYFEAAARMTNITDLPEKKAGNLSGGQKQRVAIARAIIKKPGIVLADEPTGNLDEKNSIAVLETLKEISKNALVILSTHDVGLVKQYADFILEMDYGRVKSCNLPAENVTCGERKERIAGTAAPNRDGLPVRACWLLARSMMSRRIWRTFVTVLMFIICFTGVFFTTFILSRRESKTIANYLDSPGIYLLYEEKDDATKAYSRETDAVSSGLNLKTDIENAIGSEKIGISDLLLLEDIDDDYVSLFRWENIPFEENAVTGSMPAGENEVIISRKLADRLSVTEADLPVMITTAEDNTRLKVVGIMQTDVICFSELYMFAKGGAEENENDGIIPFVYGVDAFSDETLNGQAYYECSIGNAESAGEILYGRAPENKNEVAVSMAFCEGHGFESEAVVGSTFSYKDLYDEKYGNAFYDTLNMYDIVNGTVTITGVTETGGDYTFDSDTYQEIEQILKWFNVNYAVFLGNDSSESTIRNLCEADIRLQEEKLAAVYEKWDQLGQESVYLLGAAAILFLLSLLQMLSLFSFSIRDNEQKIGVLRALGVPVRNINGIFMVEAAFPTLTALILSFGLSNWIRWAYNEVYRVKVLSAEGLQLLIPDTAASILAAFILILLASAAVLIPIKQLSGRKIIDLLHNK